MFIMKLETFDFECLPIVLQQVEAIDLFSASAEGLDTVFCFLNLQEIKFSPRNT